jgi:hypothetical protein
MALTKPLVGMVRAGAIAEASPTRRARTAVPTTMITLKDDFISIFGF